MVLEKNRLYKEIRGIRNSKKKKPTGLPMQSWEAPWCRWCCGRDFRQHQRNWSSYTPHSIGWWNIHFTDLLQPINNFMVEGCEQSQLTWFGQNRRQFLVLEASMACLRKNLGSISWFMSWWDLMTAVSGTGNTSQTKPSQNGLVFESW